MMPRPGQLRQRITIEQPIESTGDGGQPKITWQPYGTVWADVLPETGKERMEHATPESQNRWKITMRYDGNVTDRMRIRYDGILIQISGRPSHDRLKRYMYINGIEEL